MARLITTIIITFFVFISNVFSQNIEGDWYGKLDVQGTKLRISFHVKNNNGTFTTTMDSPDQKAFGIPTDVTLVTDNKIIISMKSMMIKYEGTLVDNVIKGTFNQGGMALKLDLSHQEIEKEKVHRTQTPKKPYPYKSEEVTFINKNANNIKLAGTLTLPNKVKNPAVAILISGSGPQNRDEELLGHKPFLIISDYLTKNGIAVLRIDDRGVGVSEGTQKEATSADFATDIVAAINYLKTRNDIDTNKIGLIGHSEGGFIAPIVASTCKDEVAFIILLAGPGVDGAEVLISQSKKSMELQGTPKEMIDFDENMSKDIYQFIKTETNTKKLKSKLKEYLKDAKTKAPLAIASQLTDDAIDKQIKTITSPWFTYFIKTNPKQFLKKVDCPVLALNGSKDFQVLPDLNLNAIEKSLHKNNDVTIKKMAGLNHLFQHCKTGALNEYAKIEETISPEVLKIMSDWINKRF